MADPVAARAQSLRIAMVCPYSLSRPGGVQGQVVGLARELRERGHRPTVFAPVDDSRGVPGGVDLVATGRSLALPANGSQAPVSVSPRAAVRAARTIGHGGFDVVHVHEPFSPGLPYALLLSSSRLPPMIATFHRSGSSRLYTATKPLTGRLARRYAVRCAVSVAAKETATAAVGGEYTVLFNGVEVERYQRADPWPTDGMTVLFLGRHEARKGLGVLLDAFAIPGTPRSAGGRDRSDAGGVPTGATLWIGGDGPETDELRRRHPGSDRITWLGVLSEEEKVRRLAAADVLCAPSLGGESFGMVLLEAMAARTLVVASDIDGYRDAVGDDAIVVPPGDPAALAAALRSALLPVPAGGDPRAARLVSGALRADRWSMAGLADAYEDIYRRVVADA
jgi:phosphatidylinositol alpha-mannosyltransferase